MKLVSIKEKVNGDTRWPIDCLLKNIDDYDEVFIIAKRKGEEGYTRFSSSLKSTFWWIGAIEAVKRLLMEEGLTERD